MSDAGFDEEARARRERAPRPATDRGHRPSALGLTFTVLVLALLGFAGWAWSARVHAEDVAAYSALANEIEVLDRTVPPLGHSRVPPCRDAVDGAVTRSYPPSGRTQAADLVVLLVQSGWRQEPAAASTFAHLSRTQAGHLLTIDVREATTDSALVAFLEAHSEASAFGCLLR